MKDFKQKPKWLASSANPEKYSLTIVAGVPFLVSLAALFGITLDGETIITALNQIAAGITGIATLVGIGRKFYYRFKK